MATSAVVVFHGGHMRAGLKLGEEAELLESETDTHFIWLSKDYP